nr:hypothetical protein [Chthoniobacter flavus]
MRGKHPNEERRLADWHPAESMNEHHRGTRVRRAELVEDAFEVFPRHRFMRLVVETGQRRALLEFAHQALKFDARPDLPRGQDGRGDDNRGVGKGDLLFHG